MLFCSHGFVSVLFRIFQELSRPSYVPLHCAFRLTLPRMLIAMQDLMQAWAVWA